jgi:hypothetical protein
MNDQREHGIHDLEVKNRALLGNWLYKLLTEYGVWQTLLIWIYIGSHALSQVSERLTFLGWIIAAKKHFFPFGSFSIKDGSKIRSRRISVLKMLRSGENI